MAHDPIGLLFSGRSKLYGYIDVPSLHGNYDGAQVRVQYQPENGSPWGGDSPLKGHVAFTEGRVSISLVHAIAGQKDDSMMFNGTYTLVGTDSCKAPA